MSEMGNIRDGQRPRIVILGAGFAGVEASRELAKLLPKDEDGHIVLVDQNNYQEGVS